MLQQSRRVGLRQSTGWRRNIRRWLRRHQQVMRYVLYGVGAAAVLSIVVQIAYPSDKTLPLVKVAQQPVGGQLVADISKRLVSDFDAAKVSLKTQDKTFTTSTAEAGIDIDAARTALHAAQYPFWQRLIPFSSAAIMMSRDTPVVPRYDRERLDAYAKRIQADAFVPAVNASVRVEGGSVKLVPAQPQKDYPAIKVRQVVQNAVVFKRTTISIQPDTKAAPRTNQEVDATLKIAQKAVNTPLTLEVGSDKSRVNKAAIGSWLDFPEDPKTKQLTFAIKTDVLAKYLETTYPKVYKPAGITKIQVIDGREVGRTVGAEGQGFDSVKTAAAIDSALRKGTQATVRVVLATVAPQVAYERRYSNSDVGLTALLDSIAGGYGITVMEMGGRSANTNGTKRFVSASTYKLYIAYAVAKEVEAGRMKWDDSFNGQTVASCFDRMIVVSDNACPQAFGSRFGWQNVEDMMHGLGLSDATQMSPANYTTANDLALFLYKLQNGSLLSADSTRRLIDAMKRQSYTRAGIPAGASGSTVADKVGDVDGYKHDAAIVYGPKGPYVLIVMTSGGSWSGIASVTQQIHAYLNQ